MSDVNRARRVKLDVTFAGVSISDTIARYITSLSYTDNEDGTADDLQISLHDRDGLWLQDWLQDAIEGAASAKLKISATITTENWMGDGVDVPLPCGEFELDSVTASGPPSEITIKATSLPFSAAIRQTLKSKAWENYSLSGIANEMAGNNGMSCQYLASSNPQYERTEQTMTSDISFLYKLCGNAGISLKATASSIVLFDQREYEAQAPVCTIERGKKYLDYRLSSSAAGSKYSSCRVSCVDPATGQTVEGIAKVEDYNEEDKDNQQLEIQEKCATTDEAKQVAEKRLRFANRYARTAEFTFPGRPELVAGVTMDLSGFGGWDGRYLCTQAKHTVSGSDYTTSVSLRRVLEGY